MNSIDKKIYDDFRSLREIMRMKEYVVDDILYFTKFCQTGNSRIHDYDTGFICVMIFTTRAYKGRFKTRICIKTIDDGDYGGWSDSMPLLEANETTRNVANVFAGLIVCPTINTMNFLLDRYDIRIGLE